MFRPKIAVAVLACAAALAIAPPVSAEAYPAKPIRLIVPFAPGGGTDLIGRIVAQHLGEALGEQIVVDNRGGAGSTLGTEIAAKAAPDGYTLLLGNISLAFNASLYKHLPYNAIRDLAPISEVAIQPNIMVLNPSVPAHTLKEFVVYARARPGKLTFASAGLGSGTHLAMELLKMQLKLDMIHVPYKGTGPALRDLVGGQVNSMLSTFASALPFVKGGRLRALGVTTGKRSPAAPEVPTLAEAGVPGYNYATWYGLLAPAGTPHAVIDKLNAATRKVLASPEARHRLATQGVEPVSGTAAQFGAYIKSETVKWRKVARAANIPMQ